jgi:hypothetical protein
VVRDGEKLQRRCFRLLVLVIPDGNVMLSIVDRMVDARCVATTGGRRLFCISNYGIIYVS